MELYNMYKDGDKGFRTPINGCWNGIIDRHDLFYYGFVFCGEEKWHIYTKSHFVERCEERLGSRETGLDHVLLLIDEVLFADSGFFQRAIPYFHGKTVDKYGCPVNGRLQIIDKVNGLSYILEILPCQHEILIRTVLNVQPIHFKPYHQVLEIGPMVGKGEEETQLCPVRFYNWNGTKFNLIDRFETDAGALAFCFED